LSEAKVQKVEKTMVSAREVDSSKLVAQLKERLKSVEQIKPPAWATFVKSGIHRERPPQQSDFWYVRAAAILRRVYFDGPIGVSKLRTYFGGRRRRGYRPAKFSRAGGSILRKILQQLEAADFIAKDKKGRKITPKGQKFVNGIAAEIRKEAKAG